MTTRPMMDIREESAPVDATVEQPAQDDRHQDHRQATRGSSGSRRSDQRPAIQYPGHARQALAGKK